MMDMTERIVRAMWVLSEQGDLEVQALYHDYYGRISPVAAQLEIADDIIENPHARPVFERIIAAAVADRLEEGISVQGTQDRREGGTAAGVEA